jgi:hypothetical protein
VSAPVPAPVQAPVRPSSLCSRPLVRGRYASLAHSWLSCKL